MIRTDYAPSMLNNAPGSLVLRVRGTARDGQTVQLKSPKCTIGSGPNCTLRLRSGNVGEVHCLVLRGQGGTVVRRWSADTRLNGRSFDDAHLKIGDCLSVGGIDLDVVETNQPESLDPHIEISRKIQAFAKKQAEFATQQAAFAERTEEFAARQAEMPSGFSS